jgi:hypothetical protein
MPEHQIARQAERETELAHLVLEQLAQRLQQLEVQRLGQAANIVVRFDGVRRLAAARGFDHVGIDRSLRQPLRVRQSGRFCLKNVNELAPDNLALLLRIGDPGKRVQEDLACIDHEDLDAEVFRERVHDLRRLV